MSETQNQVSFNKTDFINALKQDFATTVNKIFVNGLKKDVSFREIKVQEQKTLSRILIENEHRKDVVYDTQCQLINTVSLTEGFDIYEATEFDKIKLMMALYQSNMPKNELTFICKECGTENKYKIDFKNVIAKLDQFNVSPRPFKFENDNHLFEFTIAYPKVRTVSQFYRQFSHKYRGMTKAEADTFNNQINIDYINLFISEVKIHNKETGKDLAANLDDFSMEERDQIISSFPQDVMYNENSILNFIAVEFLQKINKTFDTRKCGQCGAVYDEQLDRDVQSFF